MEKNKYEKFGLANNTIFDIISESYVSINELIEIYVNNKEINDKLHKKSKFDTLSQSVFIDSLLMGLPVGSVILLKSNKSTTIVDGYKRISTIYKFIYEKVDESYLEFRISNNNIIHKNWRDKKFSELDCISQNSIKYHTIRSIFIKQNFDEISHICLEDIVERYKK